MVKDKETVSAIEELKPELNDELHTLFDEVPFSYSFHDNDAELHVSWVNGPQKSKVESVARSVYKHHGIELKKFTFTRLFDRKGINHISELWNENFGSPVTGHYGAVGYREVDVPSSLSKTGRAFIPVLRDDYDGFVSEKDRKFWQIPLKSLVEMSEPDKVIGRKEPPKGYHKGLDVSEILR